VNAQPWGHVFVNGDRVGMETPISVRLPAGRYRLRVEHPTKGAEEHVVTIRAGKRRLVNATFGAR
jgi:hypothetical protein